MNLRAIFAQHWKSFAALAGTLALGGVLCHALYQHMVVRGLQAEAQLYLAYLQTLENAYGIEYNKFVPFEDFYGAPLEGKDRCRQPDGAKELGFHLSWCHKAGQTPLRYAYRVMVPDDVTGKRAFRAEAMSGSDENRASFICFGDQETDVWSMDESRNLVRITACE